jgi:hypothetical protein
MTKHKRFELSEQTAALVRYLHPMEKGLLIKYAELSKNLGFLIDARNPKLTYARKILQRQHNAVWICVAPRVGIKRLTDVEIAERLPTWWLKGARSKLKRGSAQADAVELQALDVNQQARFAVDSIQAELAHSALSKATRRRMEKVARGTSNDLPSFTAVEWAINLAPRAGK